MTPQDRDRDGAIRLEGQHGSFAIECPAPGVVVLRISGHDVGEFGSAPMRAIERHLPDGATIELFIDARDTEAASIDVSGEWARWLAAQRPRCTRICMLTGSRFIQVTAEFVRRFSDLGDIMRIYWDAAAFDAVLSAAIAGGGRGS